MSNRIEQQIEALLDALRASEQEEKKRYNAAIDIEDMTEATAVTIDARTKIQQLRKWTEVVLNIQKDILASSFSAGVLASDKTSIPPIQEPEHNKVPDIEETPSNNSSFFNAGEYVRQKLHQLSKSGFLFSEEQLNNIQDYMWCRNNLRLPHPLARIYDNNKDILEQTAIADAPRRYWVKEKFRFGDVTLLIYSGWASLYIPFFDKWYDSLLVDVVDENLSDTDSTTSIKQIILPENEDDSEQVKVGFYVRNKLRELSHTGFIPSNEDVVHWQDKSWSKRTLNLNYVFARLYSEEHPMNAQIVIDDGKYRYWAETFEFGSIKLLFCSQWYRQDREFFDRWYNSLGIDEKAENKEEYNSIPSNPSEFLLFGTVHTWYSWADVLVKFCEEMILRNPYEVLGIGVKREVNINGSTVLWYNEREESENAYKLSNGLSLMSDISGSEIITCCERIIDLCGYNRNELQIR